MDKIYEFKILFGFKTDTYDILGLIEKMNFNDIDISKVIEYTQRLEGTHTQYFPPFSSICVANKNGLRKPLWWWSKNNLLNEIEIPSKIIEIYEMKFLNHKTQSFDTIFPIIKERISKLKGEFRQKEILELWNKYYKENKDKKFTILKFRSKVSSGTYIRSIIQKIAKQFDTSAIAYDINRKKIGIYG